MSIVFFGDVLNALGKKVRFESISNLYGNSFCKDPQKYIEQVNPFVKPSKINKAMMGILSSATKIMSKDNSGGAFTKQNVAKTMGDVSWADGLFSAPPSKEADK